MLATWTLPGGFVVVAIEKCEKMPSMVRRSCPECLDQLWPRLDRNGVVYQEGEDPARAELEPLNGPTVLKLKVNTFLLGDLNGFRTVHLSVDLGSLGSLRMMIPFVRVLHAVLQSV